MNYYQVELTLLFKAKVAYLQTNETLAKNMALVMLNDPYLKEVHGRTGFKPYVFSLPYPYEKKTKSYEPNKPYRFTIRSIDETFIYSLDTSVLKGDFVSMII